jgi:hypothetical protein
LGAHWKVLAGVAAIAGVVLVGLMLARPVGKTLGGAPEPPVGQPGPQAAAQPDHPPSLDQPGQRPPPALQTNGPLPSLSAASGNLITNWEDKLEETLATEATTDAKARQMLDMFPHLPEAGQIEVAKHLSNLVSDQDYGPVGQLLSDPRLPQEVLETLLADVLNRPNSLKLPALLEVARTTHHPKAADAREVLGFFLETDFGDDWPKWQEKVQQWLKDNPD